MLSIYSYVGFPVGAFGKQICSVIFLSWSFYYQYFVVLCKKAFPTQIFSYIFSLKVYSLAFLYLSLYSTRNKVACSAGDFRDSNLIPGLGRSLGEGHGNPHQYSCLEYPTGNTGTMIILLYINSIRLDFGEFLFWSLIVYTF